MAHPEQFETQHAPTWCPGCGDFVIWQAVKAALARLGKEPHECVVVFDIGCSGNMADKLRVYGFHGLHGRALPVAEGVKLANHHLPVLAIAGDGGGYGEGLSHLLHASRGNHDITYLVHNNEVYGLTKGQSSPTSPEGFRSSSTPAGDVEMPLNPLSLALASGATFVGRGFAGDTEQLTDLLVRAMQHRGFSLLDVLQPCVTYNRMLSYGDLRKRMVHRDTPAPTRQEALAAAYAENGTITVGVFYENEDRPVYHERHPQLRMQPLVDRPLDGVAFGPLFAEYQ